MASVSTPNSHASITDTQSKPSLVIVGESGRISSRIDDGALVPDYEIISNLRLTVPDRLQQRFSRINTRKPKNGLILGSEVDLKRLEQFGQGLQEVLRNTRQSVIVLVSTSKAARYAIAAGLALSPEDLQNEDVSRSLILAASSHPYGVENSDAQSALDNAVELSSLESMRGRAGVLYGKNLYALPGLEVEDQSEPTVFTHRLAPMASREASNRWYFTAERHPSHFPLGEPNESFQLKPGVRTLVIPEDPAETKPDIPDLLDGGFGRDLNGIVLKTSGHHDIASNVDKRTLENLDRADKPVMYVGKKNGTSLFNEAAEDAAEILHNAPFFMNGDGLPSGQAKIILSEALATADRRGITEVVERMRFVRSRVEDRIALSKLE